MYLGKRFIHRLHVLNPLTNSDIIGNVQYFMAKLPEKNPIQPSNSSQAVTSSIATTPSQLGVIQENEEDNIKIVVDPGSATTNNTQETNGSPSSKKPKSPLRIVTSPTDHASLATPTIIGSAQFTGPLSARVPPTPSVIDVERGKPADWTLAAHAVAEDTDDELGRASVISNVARRVSNSISRTRRSLSVRKPSVGPAGYDSEKGTTSFGRASKSLYEVPMPASPSRAGSPISMTRSMTDETPLKIVAKHPSGPVRANTKKKAKVPAGVITRFALPVPKEEILTSVPKTLKGNRRALSFRNAISATGQPASFEDWLQMIKDEKNGLSGQDDDVFDVVKPFSGLSPSKDKSLNSISEKDEVNGTGTEETKESSPVKSIPATASQESQKEATQIYDAVLFATDNDFLEMSKIRALFRENAITSDDAKLFEMPAYTGEESRVPEVEIMEDPLLCECCSPSAESLAHASPAYRWFHLNKCYLLVVLLVLVMVAIIVICVLVMSKPK